MKKQFLTAFILCVSVLLIGAQSVSAWTTWSDNGTGYCKACHPEGTPGSAMAPELHGITAHSTCSNCHSGSPAVGNVAPSACIVCHPAGDVGLCPLIGASASHGATCLACHTTCAPATTTTTTATADCLTFVPNTVEVSGTDETLDVAVTFTKAEIGTIPPGDDGDLVVVVNTTCANYITVNSVTNVVIDEANFTATATANITVQGDALSSQCSISASYSSAVITTPITCSATFTITQATAPCSLSVEPGLAFLPLRGGLFPHVRRIIVSGVNSNWNQTSVLTVEDTAVIQSPFLTQPDRIIGYLFIPSTLSDYVFGEKLVSVVTDPDLCQGTINITAPGQSQ